MNKKAVLGPGSGATSCPHFLVVVPVARVGSLAACSWAIRQPKEEEGVDAQEVRDKGVAAGVGIGGTWKKCSSCIMRRETSWVNCRTCSRRYAMKASDRQRPISMTV